MELLFQFQPLQLQCCNTNCVSTTQDLFVVRNHLSSLTLFFFQTKDALFTILKDLRPGDHFNFISFSNKIKVWKPHELVPVTPLNIRDAKKFIFTLATTGGQMLFSLWPVFFTVPIF